MSKLLGGVVFEVEVCDGVVVREVSRGFLVTEVDAEEPAAAPLVDGMS